MFWSETIVRNNRQTLQHRYFSIAIAALQQQYDIRRWQIARNIGTRFLSASRYTEERRVTEDQMTAVEEILEFTQKLFEAGEVSRIGISNIELELATLKQKLVELELKREFEIRALAIPLGLSIDTTLPATDLPNVYFEWQATVDELMDADSISFEDEWVAVHPQLNFALAQAEQSRWSVSLAKAERNPDVQVQGSVNYDTETDSVFAGFQVGVPVQKYDNKSGAIGAANAEYRRRLEEVRLKQMQLQARHTIGEGEMARLRSRVINIRDVIIPKAKENLAQVRSAFEIGEIEFLVLKTALDQVLQSRLDLLQAEHELAIASVNLGTLLLDE